MKLSHESKIRLGVLAASVAALIVAMWGLSFAWGHAVENLNFRSIAKSIGEDADSPESRGYSAKFTKLSSASFAAESVQALDFDVSSGTVETKVIDGDKVVVRESAHVKHGIKPARAATKGLATVEGGVLKIARFDYDDGSAIGRVVTVGIPRKLAGKLSRVNLNVDSGDVKIDDVTCGEFTVNVASGDVELKGGVTEKLDCQVDSGDVEMTLDQAPAKSMDVREGSGDIEISIPEKTGFTAQLTVGSGDFTSDFLTDEVDGDDVSNMTFDNGDKSATYTFDIGSGDMTLDAH